MLIHVLGKTALTLYYSVVIILCGSFLKQWYDFYRCDISNAVDNIRMKIGL